MRARSLAIFALGFAAGALCISLLLWGTGDLRTPRTPAVVRAQPESPSGSSAPAPDTAPQPSPPVAASGPPGPKTEGSADRQQNTLLLPVPDIDPGKLSDTFSELRDGRKHEALDILAPRGTPVRACAEGNVVKLFQSKQGGLTVYQFDDSQTYCYYYAHLDHYAPGLREGTLLRRGDVLGYVGSTGNASPQAPHLHFAIFALGPDKKWWHGTPIDPLPMFR